MAIQVRRGAYADFDPTKMVAGEPAAVMTGQPNSDSGSALYISFANGSAERMASYSELSDAVNTFEESVQDATEAATEASAAAVSVANSIPLIIAPAYSTSSTYAVGDCVTYNNRLYQCTTAIATPEAWTPAHWSQKNIMQVLASGTVKFTDPNDTGDIVISF